MAGETMAQKFLFLPRARLHTTFRYHALHDIESAWWLGVWMLHFYKPARHEESREISLLRQHETFLLFPGTLIYDRRQINLENKYRFINTTAAWIAAEFNSAVERLNDIRILLLQHYLDLEQTFPNGLPMLSSPANPASGAAFPGGPVVDIHEPIKKLFLAARNEYRNTTIVSFKVLSNE